MGKQSDDKRQTAWETAARCEALERLVRGYSAKTHLTVRSHPNGFFDSQPNMCCGCFGCGLRRVSKKDERLAALRSDVEPICGVHAQHTYWRYVADFPHVRCSLRLTVCQPSRRNGVRLRRRRSAPTTLCSCCSTRMDQGASGRRCALDPTHRSATHELHPRAAAAACGLS